MRRLWWLGFLGFAGLVHDSLDSTRPFLLFFLAPLLADAVAFVRRLRSDDAAPPPPLPGPARSALATSIRYAWSSSLGFLDAGQRRALFRQLRGDAAARRRVRDHEPTPDTWRPTVRYTLPFRGEWLVVNGGVTRETSHSWDLIAQRYAYDFVTTDAEDRRHRGDGARLDDYFCYGAEILAPADGVVVAVVDGVRDAPRVGTGWVDWHAPSIGGNSITIRHAEGEFSYLAHLIPGSIAVQPGEQVRRGQSIARCGNSGHSTEPHLHFQLQDAPDFHEAVGLPIRFAGVEVNGTRAADDVYLTAGQRVRALEPSKRPPAPTPPRGDR